MASLFNPIPGKPRKYTCWWKQPEPERPKPEKPKHPWRSAKTPEQKRRMAAHLQQHDPEMLDVIKEFSAGFGQLEEAKYRRR